MRRYCLIVGFVFIGLMVGLARGDTFKLLTGEELVGEVLPSTGNDAEVQIKVGDGNYQHVGWTNFSQDDLKRLSRNQRLEPFIEPYIEITTAEKLQKTEVNIKQPPRLERPARRSLIGALFGSGLGLFILLVLYVANVYAGYEVALFRGQPVEMVCGLAAVLPVAGPIIFLSMPTKLKSSEPAVEVVSEEGEATGAPGTDGGATAAVNPMQADGVEHPAGLKLAHAEGESKPVLPETTTYQRGQFTFNRRFFETKFPGFFGVIRRDTDKDMVLVIKCARGEYFGQRISRIAANDLHLQVQKGAASEEIMIPFQEIQQIRLKHKDA